MSLAKQVTIKCGIKKGANGALVFCKDGITANCIDYMDEEGCPYKITVWTIREAINKDGKKIKAERCYSNRRP